MFGRSHRELFNAACYDLLPAIAVAGITMVLVVVQPGSASTSPVGNLENAAAAGSAFVGLALRRHAPLATLAALVAVYLIVDYGFFGGAAQEPFAVFLGILVLAYNTGAHTRSWQAVFGATILVLFLVTQAIPVTRGGHLGDAFLTCILLTSAWVIGRGLQRYRDLTALLRTQAAQLERERDERTRLAIALERARIARELHDVISHSVTVMVVQAAAERRLMALEEKRTREVLEMIERTGRQALVELRRMLGVLRKTDHKLLLAPQPGLGDLGELISQVREAGLPVEVRFEGSPSPLPAGVELSAYRIVQEGLTNALKHAGAARAEVTLRYLADRLELEVVDNGRGSCGEGGLLRGHGLVGMRERVAVFGGSLQAGRRESGGFAITATLPFERIAQ